MIVKLDPKLAKEGDVGGVDLRGHVLCPVSRHFVHQLQPHPERAVPYAH
jgi:hypothetical protein